MVVEEEEEKEEEEEEAVVVEEPPACLLSCLNGFQLVAHSLGTKMLQFVGYFAITVMENCSVS